MGIDASTEETIDTRMSAGKEGASRLTVTMRTLVPKDPSPTVMLCDKESGVGVRGTVKFRRAG